jgi:hypothetical protein
MAGVGEWLRGMFGTKQSVEEVETPGSLVPHPPMRPKSLVSFARGNNDFALALYGQLRQRPGNLFFSPFSIRTALGSRFLRPRPTSPESTGANQGIQEPCPYPQSPPSVRGRERRRYGGGGGDGGHACAGNWPLRTAACSRFPRRSSLPVCDSRARKRRDLVSRTRDESGGRELIETFATRAETFIALLREREPDMSSARLG